MGLDLLLFTITWVASAQAGTILDAHQVEDRLEVLVINPEREYGSLYFQQAGQIEGPIRLAPGENRYSYRILREGEPLALRSVGIGQFDSSMQMTDSLLVEVVEPWDVPNEPALALTPADIDDLQKRYAFEFRASRTLDKLLDDANEGLAGPVFIPDEGGTWSEGYRCPDHGNYLEMQTLTSHRCPVDGVIWTGKEFDRALATYLHDEAGRQAWIEAVAFILTEDMVYGQRVKDILLGYAAKYPGYPQHDLEGRPSPRGGKAFGQTLDESLWLVDLARAYDLLRGSSLLSEAEMELINENLLRPAMHVLLSNDLGIKNIQAWHNSGIFYAAMMLGDTPTANDALRGPTGLEKQAELGVDADGLWYEGSFGYHYFTFRGMLPMLQALHRLNLQFEPEEIESMLTLPLQMAFPDGSLPMLNNGSFQTFAENLRNDYEQALAFWPTADFCSPLVKYGRGDSYASVIYGLADLPFDDTIEYPGVNFEISGLSAMRTTATGGQTTAVVDYGAHGDFHGHYDKLGLSVWHLGKPVVLEAGAIGYGTALTDGYYKTTLAHNTVLIDGMDQQETAGKLEDFQVVGDNTWLLTSADDAYPGVSFRRQVLNSETGHVVDGVEINAASEVVIDYVLHSAGTISHNYALTSDSLGYGGAYSFLSNVKGKLLTRDLSFRFDGPEGSAVVNVIGEPGTRVFVATAPGYPAGTTHDVLILRRQASHTVFGTTITENGSATDGFEVELDDKPGDPALFLKIFGSGQVRLPFYP